MEAEGAVSQQLITLVMMEDVVLSVEMERDYNLVIVACGAVEGNMRRRSCAAVINSSSFVKIVRH